ncbi:MAG TPA: hypothetical protein VES61_05170 [Gaiellaceae bacterium]|nr:hypothetical protein [Gaiellaceae bacterium]
MKRGFVYLVALAALMALPSVAAAAKWNGVVVAKDRARQAFVTASPGGTLRTVRAPARFGSLRVGAKVAVRGLRLSDGTFRSRSVRRLGRSKLALLDAVVVRQRGNRGRTILSGGGTVFSMRGGEHHDPGDEVECLVRVKAGHLRAVDCEETGHADAMKLEGIFLDASDGVLRIAVLKRGLVIVNVPDGVEVPTYEPGDLVVLLVSIGEDGSFTLVSSRGDVGKDDDDGGVEFDDDGVVVVGMYKGVEAGRVYVRPDEGAKVSCVVPEGADLSGFVLYEEVEMHCTLLEGELVLASLESETASWPVDPEETEDEF